MVLAVAYQSHINLHHVGLGMARYNVVGMFLFTPAHRQTKKGQEAIKDEKKNQSEKINKNIMNK